MRKIQSRKSEAKLAAEKRTKFRGSARIRLEFLHFPENLVRRLDRANVERLKSCDNDEGCHQLDHRYHVSVVVDEQDRQQAI
jgi:hypothetical protein